MSVARKTYHRHRLSGGKHQQETPLRSATARAVEAALAAIAHFWLRYPLPKPTPTPGE